MLELERVVSNCNDRAAQCGPGMAFDRVRKRCRERAKLNQSTTDSRVVLRRQLRRFRERDVLGVALLRIG